MKALSSFDWVAMVLTLVGGLNWGLIAFFNFNLVTSIVGDTTNASRIVYGLVGLSALYLIITIKGLGRK